MSEDTGPLDVEAAETLLNTAENFICPWQDDIIWKLVLLKWQWCGTAKSYNAIGISRCCPGFNSRLLF